MKRRIRSLLAILLSLTLLCTGSGVVWAEEPEAEPVTGLEDESEASSLSVGSVLRLSEAGGASFGGYTITGNTWQYRYQERTFYGNKTYDRNPFKVYDPKGNEVNDYTLNIDSIIYNGKEYSFWDEAYWDGLTTEDTIDFNISLTIPDYYGLQPAYDVYKGIIKNITIIKYRITPDSIYFSPFRRGIRLEQSLENNTFSEYLFIGNMSNVWADLYMQLTDDGLDKVGDFSSSDIYELQYEKDFSLSVRVKDRKTWEYEDITDNFEFDLDGYTATINVENSYYLCFDIEEVQAGVTPIEFREILKKHAFLYENDKRLDWDSSEMEMMILGPDNSRELPYDERKTAELLKKEGEYIFVNTSTNVYDNGILRKVESTPYFRIFKNSYNLYLEPFEEVASTTGASYQRTEHDFMVNLYAIKNENEKIRVGSLGEGEAFKLSPFIYSKYDFLRDLDSINSFFDSIRPGYELFYQLRWSIPDKEDDSKYGRRSHYFGTFDDLTPKDPLIFFEYEGKEEEKEDESSDPAADPFSDLHNTDGSNEGALKADSPSYVFDPVKSNTLIGAVKVDISKKFEGHVSANGYNASAKHRYTVDNKKLAKIDKKGNITPKKSGTIKISLEQKVKGSGWTKIGDPVTMYIQVPEIKKSESSSAGQTIDGRSLVQKTTYAPIQWESSNPSVAAVDAKTGKITVHKKGKTKIYAVYGVDSGSVKSSKKKYRVKLKVS